MNAVMTFYRWNGTMPSHQNFGRVPKISNFNHSSEFYFLIFEFSLVLDSWTHHFKSEFVFYFNWLQNFSLPLFFNHFGYFYFCWRWLTRWPRRRISCPFRSAGNERAIKCGMLLPRDYFSTNEIVIIRIFSIYKWFNFIFWCGVLKETAEK